LQDETNPGNLVLINTITGEYSFNCNGVLIAGGRGTLNVKGCEGTIEHNREIAGCSSRGILPLQEARGRALRLFKRE
jgi:hypothetical protein